MPRVARILGPLEVRRLTAKPGEHAVGGVPGLILQVGQGEASSWILRVTVGKHGHGGQRRAEIGLGPFPAVTLAQARELASQMRQQIQNGVNPLTERQAARSRLVAEHQRTITFEQAATQFIRKKSAEWDNQKHQAQWESTLNTYAYPIIGRMAVADIDTAHIVRVLEPIWHEKTETATRVRSRIEAVLGAAIALKYRTAPNPAAWRGHLDKIFAAPAKIRPERHQPALGIDDTQFFMRELLAMDGMGACALAFTILTAVRSSEAREAVWDEIDMDGAIWTIPAERMKARREHTVPLSVHAVDILKKLPRIEKCKYLFPSANLKPLSDMTLSAVIKRMNASNIAQGGAGYFDRRQKRVATVHGFRSTFRDWSAERMNVPNEVCEMALAHGIKDRTEAAYRRGDLFGKRMKLMQAWSNFLFEENDGDKCE